MFSAIKKLFVTAKVQYFNYTFKNHYKVAVVGAAGGVGQPLSMLLKTNPDIKELCLYDIAPVTKGVAVDISHINTPAKVLAYVGPEEFRQAIIFADLVMVAAGASLKPKMTLNDLFKINAPIMTNIARMCAKYAPFAVMAIITEPLNSTVPIANEVYKKCGTYDPRKVLGVTTLNGMRASAFTAEMLCMYPEDVDVPVVGGNSENTILPLMSQFRHTKCLDPLYLTKLTKRIQQAGTEVVNLKAGAGSATLSTAIAAARLAGAIIEGFNGKTPIEAAYVENVLTPAKYFAAKCRFGKNGVEACYSLGCLSPYENDIFIRMIPELLNNIQQAEEYVAKNVFCC